jgi:hypothetical protein
MQHGRRQFYLKWKGCSNSENSWANEEDLQCNLLLADYLRTKSEVETTEKAGRSTEKVSPPLKPTKHPKHVGLQLVDFPIVSSFGLIPAIKVLTRTKTGDSITYSIRIDGKETVQTSSALRNSYPHELAQFLQTLPVQ